MEASTIQQTFDLALQHHRAARLAEAERLYRQVLARQPQYADAIQNLGILAGQLGRKQEALELNRRVVSLRPDSADAQLNLGNALRDAGESDQAIAAFGRAIALRPDFAQAHSNLGNVLRSRGELDNAIAAFGRAIALSPGLFEVHNNLGDAMKEKGLMDQAIAAYREALILNPNLPENHYKIGNLLREAGRLDEAIAAYRRAIVLRPDYPGAYNGLGITLAGKGQIDDAIAAVRRAIELDPNYPEAFNNLANFLKHSGQLDEAIATIRQAIVLRPGYAEAYCNLGILLRAHGWPDEAIAAYRQAIALDPQLDEASSNLGVALKDTGRLDDAIAAFGPGIRQNDPRTHSNLLLTLLYHPAYDARAIAEELRRWDQRHAQPLSKFIPRHSNDRDPDRRLRIGYVSPNFRDHVLALYMVPLLSCHDHGGFEIVCYSDVRRPTAMTARMKGYADAWCSTLGMSDQQMATQIERDQIDILVDLTMHTADNRLLVFARKPAPVQASWMAYPASTGLSAIDYRLSDSYLDPADRDETIYSERTIRLPDSFWCYDPLEGRKIPVNSLPALTNGYITFGCLNTFYKINDGVLSLWAQVMGKVKGSRLLMLAPPGSHRQRILDRFSQEGIESNRIEFVPLQSRGNYLKTFNRVDLGLDSFPYNGHTTSLDSLWMGVPVITLVGQSTVSRAGLSLYSNLGLMELAAQSCEQFVKLAVDLAGDLPRLQELRRTLRLRMEQSPLMDAPRFVRNVEAAYRQMWQNWCNG